MKKITMIAISLSLIFVLGSCAHKQAPADSSAAAPTVEQQAAPAPSCHGDMDKMGPRHEGKCPCMKDAKCPCKEKGGCPMKKEGASCDKCHKGK